MGALDGQIALVTGASRGIGAATAALLGAEGARVIRVARSLAKSPALNAVDVIADLATDDGIARLVAATLEIGLPDLIVSNAGGFELGEIGSQVTASLDRLYQVNLRAPTAVAEAFVPAMRTRGSGRHIMIGSVADHRAFPGNAAYAATKFGLRGLHEALRAECQGTGVLCTLISPGPVDTAVWDPIDPDHRPGFPRRATMLQPGDVAEAVRWVACQPRRVDTAWIQLYPA